MIIFSIFIQISGSFVSLRISLARSRPKCHWKKANILNDLRASRCCVFYVYIVTGVIDLKKKEKKKGELRPPFIYCLIYARIECTEYS